MLVNGLENIERIYFIGIGGISMNALAKFFAEQGYCVSGSDVCESELTRELSFYGIKVFIGGNPQRKELLQADCVVYTDAIRENDGELVHAKSLGKRVIARAELLEIVSQNFKRVVSVAGSHGKTTCASMCAHILKSCKVPFTSHIGGVDLELGNFYSVGREYLVTEACEYKKNLLKIPSDVAVLLNIDKDHMECYDGEDDLVDTFFQYGKKARTALACADDALCKRFTDFSTFAIRDVFADYRAVQIRAYNEQYAFTILEYGRKVGRVKLNCVGYCNIYNALAAFGAMRSLGFNETEIVNGLESFSGVKRRFEKIGSCMGVNFVCDYAHHPREIASTFMTAQKICRGNLYVVFQPHTYSRTKFLMDDFVQTLRGVSNLIIYKTYSAREQYDKSGSAQTLANNVGNCSYADNENDLRRLLSENINAGDMVLFLGAGDIYSIAKNLVKEIAL